MKYFVTMVYIYIYIYIIFTYTYLGSYFGELFVSPKCLLTFFRDIFVKS